MSVELECLVQLVRDAGIATGHADDAEGLMREVLEQVEGLRGRIAGLEAGITQAAWELTEAERERDEALARLRDETNPGAPRAGTTEET